MGCIWFAWEVTDILPRSGHRNGIPEKAEYNTLLHWLLGGAQSFCGVRGVKFYSTLCFLDCCYKISKTECDYLYG